MSARQTGAGKKIGDIAKAASFAVQLIFALARQIKPTRDRNRFARCKVKCERTRTPMAFCFYLCLDRLSDTDGGAFTVSTSIVFVAMKTIFFNAEFGIGMRISPAIASTLLFFKCRCIDEIVVDVRSELRRCLRVRFRQCQKPMSSRTRCRTTSAMPPGLRFFVP